MAIALNNHQVQRFTNNTNSYTLSSYAVPAGSDKALVVMLSGLRTNENAINWSAGTFGGVAMTEVVASKDTSSSRAYYAGVWILVNPSGTGDITFTLAGGNLAGAIISAVTLTGVDQVTPVAFSDSYTTTTDMLSMGAGYALSIWAVASNANNYPAWAWSSGLTPHPTELYDLTDGSSTNNEIAGSAAYRTGAATYTEATCSEFPARTVGVWVGINEAAAVSTQPPRTMHQFAQRRVRR